MSVLNDWVVEQCSWKEQTVLMCALRGPDTGGSPEVKSIIRWLRRAVLGNAAPHKTFMQPEAVRRIRDLADNSPLCLDMLPVHFLSHLMHAVQVVAERCPGRVTASLARAQYIDLCDYLHINPETSMQMEQRLKDERHA